MKTLGEPDEGVKRATRDPVCGMVVVPGKTKLVTVYYGHSFWFCSRRCREAFEARPQKYLDNEPRRRMGWFGRIFSRPGREDEDGYGRDCKIPSGKN